jgi:hypothetical protein
MFKEKNKIKKIKKPELMSPIKNFSGLEACKNYAMRFILEQAI